MRARACTERPSTTRATRRSHAREHPRRDHALRARQVGGRRPRRRRPPARRAPGQGGRLRACATPTTTSPPATCRSAIPVPRRPRGRRRRHRRRPRHEGLRGGRPRRLLVPARLRPLPLVRQRPAVPLRLRRQPAGRLAVGRRRRASGSRPPTAADVGQMCGLGTFAEVTTVDVRLDGEDPTRASRSRSPASSAAASAPAGAPPSRPARSGPATRSSSWASAASASTPSRARRTPAPATSSPSTRSPSSARRPWSWAPPTPSRTWRRRPSSPAASPTARARTRRIVTVGVLKGEHVAQAFEAIGKGGRVVVTGLGDLTDVGIPINPSMLALFTKEIQGALFGDQNPSTDILKMLRLYQEGKLKLDELITTPVQARRHQPGLRGHARRQEHPRRDHLRLSPTRPPGVPPARPRRHPGARLRPPSRSRP